MKMETPKKNNAPHTYTTLKECLKDPRWEKAYNLLLRNIRTMIKNNMYDD